MIAIKKSYYIFRGNYGKMMEIPAGIAKVSVDVQKMLQ